MRVLVVGGGGREHAIIKSLKKNSRITELFCAPGNGGIGALATCVDIKAVDLDGILNFCLKNAVDYVVVSPDDPLISGLVDHLNAHEIPAFGPTKAAARIEGSKRFAKELMQKYGIKTAAFASFCDAQKAIEYLKTQSFPIVIKADGPALGKGVVIAEDFETAKTAVLDMIEGHIFGSSGCEIVIEEFLTGVEVSLLTLTDGKTIIPLKSATDHKRAYDGDKGPNTGGMGCISPSPFYTQDVAVRCMEEIFIPTIRAMAAEGYIFKGCLYFGLILTDNGPYVIEYNCRFGDPETQALLPLLETDLFDAMQAVTNGNLCDIKLRFSDLCACSVILASGGYPTKPDTGHIISGIPEDKEDFFIYHCGTALQDGNLINSGGRVLCVTATGETLSIAKEMAYKVAKGITFENMRYRNDIGERVTSGGL